MADPRQEAGRKAAPPGKPIRRAAPPPPPTAKGRSAGVLPVIVISLGAVAVAAVFLDRAISPPPSGIAHRTPAADPALTAIPEPPAPSVSEGGGSAGTAPALSRATQEKSVVPGLGRQHVEPPHPMPEQLAAARQIAETRREEIRREAVARAAPPPRTSAVTPRLAPPGRVVQLGTYPSAREAEAAAKRFRFRYRGLLNGLEKGVVPYRPGGAAATVYRVQFVTPSQAYAEITCQRLRAARKTCIVIY